jgi:hypothetical protein
MDVSRIRIICKCCFYIVLNSFIVIIFSPPYHFRYLSHVAAAKYSMPELKVVEVPKFRGDNNTNGGDRRTASSAILSQMSRIEKVIGAMSRRISNIEKSMVNSSSVYSDTSNNDRKKDAPRRLSVNTINTMNSIDSTKGSPRNSGGPRGPRRVPGTRSSLKTIEANSTNEAGKANRAKNSPIAFDIKEHL